MSHAKLAPSAAHRWSVCTASVGFIEENADKLPPSGGVYADEGTLAHELAATSLTAAQMPQISDAMRPHVEAYVKFINDQTLGKPRVIERRVPLYYSPEDHGTIDAGQITPERVFIGDLKYGAGVSVDAVENKQLAIYAESFIRHHEEIMDIADTTTVSINIFQPRDRNNPEPLRNWTLTRAELREYLRENVDRAVGEIRNPDLPKHFVADPDEQCRFCPAKGLCKAYALYGLQDTPLALEVFEDPAKVFELPKPDALDRETRVKVIKAAPAIKKWFTALEDLEMATLMSGGETKGMKLVEGRSNRTWVDVAKAERMLRNYLKSAQIYPPSEIISPSKAEELLKAVETSARFQTRFDSLVYKPEGKPTLVPESDKRPALDLNQTKLLPVVQESETVI